MVNTPDTPDKTDAPSGESAFDGLKDKSLKATGYAYLIGDAGLFASGMLSKRYKEASSGLLWAAGGLACAKYANPDAEKQFELLGDRLAQYLKKQGVPIPDDPTTEVLTRERGVVDHIEAFLHQYPSQVLNATFAIGATQLLRSGLQHNKPWDTASGALVAAGALAGLLIQEKKPDPDHHLVGAFEKAKAWIQEKPLRVPGILYGLNNITLITSAVTEAKSNPAQKSYMFKFLTAASYIFANTMLSMSSKKQEGGQHDVAMDKLAKVSARVVAAQAPEVQEALVQHISSFLSCQPDVSLKTHEISDLLHQKLKEVSRPQPKISLENWQQRVQEQTPNMAPSV